MSKNRRLEDKFEIQHVGSSLLHELARGLYQPESVIREYIQNAIDAHRLWELETGLNPEQPILVEFRANGISILDCGVGMTLEEVRNVKSVAVSHKQNVEHFHGLTGHKGVGIWAGLSFFESLTLRTTKKGQDKGYQVTLRFKNILAAIDEKTDIGSALNPNYEIYEFDETKDDHYTNVTLQNPTQSPEWFLDREEVYNAIKRICPCRIDPNFAFHNEVEDWYVTYDFETFDISLDGDPIYRDYAGNVDDFTSETFQIGDMTVAHVWYAVSKKRSMKSTRGELLGFRIIQNGFVVGGDNPFSARDLQGFDPLSIGSYPQWFVGEIHIVAPQLHPNLARNDFKESELRRKFVQKVRKWYDGLAAKCMVLGQKRQRERQYDGYQKHLERLISLGVPFEAVPSASDVEKLNEYLAELNKDEDLAAQKIRGKSPKSAAPITAARDKEIRKTRKSLIREITNLLPATDTGGTEMPPTADDQPPPADDSEGGHVQDQPAGDDEPETGSNGKPKSTTPPPPSSPGYIPRSFWIEDADESGNGQKRVSMDVVLSFLEEILAEELPDSPETQQSIVDQLQQRIKSVMADD